MSSAAQVSLRSPVAWLLYIGAAAAGIALDLWTKALAVERLKDGPPILFIPGWLHFTYTENHGAALGMGQGKRWFFVGVSICAIFFLTYLFSLSGRRRWNQLLLGVLLAGVIGNLYDRAVYGYVRDMIHAVPDVYWPGAIAHFLPANLAQANIFPWIFNVADTLLCGGLFLLVVLGLLERPATAAKNLPTEGA